MNILDLPGDILINIFQKLDLCDLSNVILTCKAFRNFVLNDNTIWRGICRDSLILENPPRNSPNCMSWYNRCRISRNWRWGLYKDRIIVRFNMNYMPWMSYHDSEIVLLSKGYQLQCYSISRKKTQAHGKDICWTLSVPTVARHDVRTNDISRFVIRNETLVCGNRDGCASVYKIPNLKYRPQLLCHIKDCHENGQVEISAVEMVGSNDYNHVVTASIHSPNILFWQISENNRSSPENVMEIPIHDGEGVKCMAVNDCMDKLAIGLDANSCPLLFDVNSCKYLMTAEATRNPNQAIRDIGWHNENTLIYVTHSGMLHLADVRTQSTIYNARDPFLSTLYCVKSDCNNAIIAGSSEYTRCVLFDARNCSKHVQIYFTHKRLSSPVYCLDFDSTTLLAAVDRGISALNFNVNTSALRPRDYSQVFQQFYA